MCAPNASQAELEETRTRIGREREALNDEIEEYKASAQREMDAIREVRRRLPLSSVRLPCGNVTPPRAMQKRVQVHLVTRDRAPADSPLEPGGF